MNQRMIHRFPKNPLEEIRVSITEFKRRQYLDLRLYFKADNGDYLPSKKGLTLSMDLVDELETAVRMLKEAADQLGR